MVSNYGIGAAAFGKKINDSRGGEYAWDCETCEVTPSFFATIIPDLLRSLSRLLSSASGTPPENDKCWNEPNKGKEQLTNSPLSTPPTSSPDDYGYFTDFGEPPEDTSMLAIGLSRSLHTVAE